MSYPTHSERSPRSSQRILSTPINAQSLATLRNRTRQVGELFGLETLQRTRFITAVSEIARNTVQYAKEGKATFLFSSGTPLQRTQYLVAQLEDRGPGIKDVEAVLAGRSTTSGRPAMGITGCNRLVDKLSIDCAASGGTLVTLEMALPRNAPFLAVGDISALVEQLARQRPQTPLEELEQQNREMLHALQELRRKQMDLEQADERKNEFLATLAHELRNPLGTMHMTLQILQRSKEALPPRLADARDVMARQTEQMRRLVDDLLDTARVAQGKVELKKQPMEVNELVAHALEMTSSAINEKQHQITLDRSPQPLWVQVDAARLKQVLSNLIHNAARYTPAHGRIAVSVRTQGPMVVIEVADNGVGIAPDMLPHVFELFVQGNSGTGNAGSGNTSGAGLGVGLALVQRLVRDHGGDVAAASAGRGLGSSFLVSLPLLPQPGAAISSLIAASSAAMPPRPQP